MGVGQVKALREARHAHGHSQEYVGLVFGVSQAAVSYWESGLWTPSEENAAKVEEYVREMTE